MQKQIDKLQQNITKFDYTFAKQFIYKRAHENQYATKENTLNKQLCNIGILQSSFGNWVHCATGFIFKHSLQSNDNVFHILTGGNTIVNWYEDKKYCLPDNISFHISKNLDITYENNGMLPAKELSRFTVIDWKVHPKFLENKSPYHNIAIVEALDKENTLKKVKPLKLCKSTKDYKNYKSAKVFGFGGFMGVFHIIYGCVLRLQHKFKFVSEICY